MVDLLNGPRGRAQNMGHTQGLVCPRLPTLNTEDSPMGHLAFCRTCLGMPYRPFCNSKEFFETDCFLFLKHSYYSSNLYFKMQVLWRRIWGKTDKSKHKVMLFTWSIFHSFSHAFFQQSLNVYFIPESAFFLSLFKKIYVFIWKA